MNIKRRFSDIRNRRLKKIMSLSVGEPTLETVGEATAVNMKRRLRDGYY